MELIRWEVVFDQMDSLGRYTHQIKWIPPQKSGYIVQYVELEDPIGLIRIYEKPYYEAWRVKDGKVIHEVKGPEKYDDSFSNENNGEFQINRQLAIDGTQNWMRKAKVTKTYVTYKCKVFWVDEGSDSYKNVNQWKRGVVRMALNLRSSYEAPGVLCDGIDRVYTAPFQLQENDGEN